MALVTIFNGLIYFFGLIICYKCCCPYEEGEYLYLIEENINDSTNDSTDDSTDDSTEEEILPKYEEIINLPPPYDSSSN